MKTRALLFLLIALVSLASAPVVCAWDALGHMLVAQIARDQTTPEARAYVDAALARFDAAKKEDRPSDDKGYDAVTAACWMDDIKDLRDKYSFGKWHYVDLPYNAEGLPEPDGEQEPNILWAMQRCADILSGKIEDPEISKDQALVMLIHLVGDAHQPLHASNRNNDLGGNKVKLRNAEKSKEDEMFGKQKSVNLHAFWDSAYRRIFRGGQAAVIYEAPFYDKEKPALGHAEAEGLVRMEAANIEKKYPPSLLTKIGQKDPNAWIHESHEGGYNVAYGTLPDQSVTGFAASVNEPYVTAARETAQKRIALAGYRLAALMNELAAQK